MRLSLFIEKHDLVGLFGFLQNILLAATLLETGTLIAVLQPPDLTIQKLCSIQELCAFGILRGSFVSIVHMFNIGPFLHQQLAHLQMAATGSVVKRGLAH